MYRVRVVPPLERNVGCAIPIEVARNDILEGGSLQGYVEPLAAVCSRSEHPVFRWVGHRFFDTKAHYTWFARVQPIDDRRAERERLLPEPSGIARQCSSRGVETRQGASAVAYDNSPLRRIVQVTYDQRSLQFAQPGPASSLRIVPTHWEWMHGSTVKSSQSVRPATSATEVDLLGILRLINERPEGPKQEDAMGPDAPRVDLHNDSGKQWDRAQVDIDRDGKWDEKWARKKGVIHRIVSPKDDQVYTERMKWSGSHDARGWVLY